MTDAAGAAEYDEFRFAVGTFLTEFAAFESMYVETVLSALIPDQELVDCLGELMEIDKRMLLVQRLADFRKLPEQLVDEIRSARKAAKPVVESRNLVAHNAIWVIHSGVGASNLFMGLRKPRSKRKNLSQVTDKDSLDRLHTDWHVSINQIKKYTEETLKLQKTWSSLASRIIQHRQNFG